MTVASVLITPLSEREKTASINLMKITKDCMVTLEYTLKDDEGTVLDSSENTEPLDYIHGYNFLIPGMEKALEGHEEGDSFHVDIEAKDGYGEINDEMMFDAPRTDFPADVELKVGMEFEANHHRVVIKAVNEDTVTLDANHPLAGKTLHFDIEVKAVRIASQDEILAVLAPLGGCCDTGSCGGCSGCS